MGEIQICKEMGFKDNDNNLQWVFMEAKDDACNYDLMESDLDDSLESSSSIDMIEDAPSSSSSSSIPSSCSPLFELSDLMAHLPIKRGLSKFYQGKSESFASLTSVKRVADLAKKEKYCCRSRSSIKRYGQSQILSPKATIAKNKKASSSSTTAKSSIFSSLGIVATH
ncbi:hypothetical protein L1987_29284 [Smallanthus sonchifolius]|uniref:Uncharacterized protein n=1 Tax=Smallanthus sonchifolius TaxID=185202 RepID=A0ACB9HZK9_9ASTR|nr:hypothetical protein L1987_29284 [Smallanthus sonchifolius]